MQFKPPTPEESARSFRWFVVGGGIVVVAIATNVGIAATHETPLRGLWAQIAQGVIFVGALGVSALLWGLRMPARQWECDSVKRSGYTQPYEAFFSVVPVVLVIAAVAIALDAAGVVRLGPEPR